MKSFTFHKKTLLARGAGVFIALSLVLGQVLSGPSVAMAASIFTDSFGTGNTADDVVGWRESEHPNDNDDLVVAKQSSTSPSQSDYQSPDGGRFVKIKGSESHHNSSDDNAWVCRQINASGYQNLSLKYYWRGEASAEPDDKGYVEFRANGTSDSSCNSNENGAWTTLASHSLDDTNSTSSNQTQEAWALNTVNIPADSDGVFLIRFRNDSSDDAENFRIDGVSVEGTLIPTDVCLNMEGVQTEAPKGYVIKNQNDHSECVPEYVDVTLCKTDDAQAPTPLSGWTLTLNGEGENDHQGVTGQNGCYTFDNIPYGNYTVGEVLQTNWSQVSLPNINGTIQAYQEQNGPYYVVNRYTPPTPTTATVSATKIVCDAEQYLPNWGDSTPEVDITATTATDFVTASEGKCHFQSGWQFEWTTDKQAETGWSTFSQATNINGVTTQSIPTSSIVWVREVEQTGYIPFSNDTDGSDGWNDVSAEMYCGADVVNYDNLDYISGPQADTTYHCVAFNVATAPVQQCVVGENLLKNGGFETPDVSSGGYSIFPEGTTGLEWLVDWVSSAQTTGIKGLEIQDHAAGDPAVDAGDQFAELDGDHPVKISQTVQTIPGKEYKLTFKYSPRAGRSASDNSLLAKVGGTTLATLATDGSSKENTAWESITRTFVADSTSTTVEFYDNGDDTSYGGYLDDVALSCVGDPTPHCDEGSSWDAEKKQCVPNDTTSDVTMCKIDANGTKLSGWTLMLLDGAKIDSLSVPSTSSVGVNSVSLLGQTPYVAVASGTWNNQGGANVVDAEYSTTDAWSTHMDGYTGYQTDILELQINNTFDPASWGAYNSLHQYAQAFTQAAAGPANFRIFDGTGTQQDEGWFADNSGSLTVDLYKGYTGVTDQSGCVTFKDVPFGSYTVSEMNQTGWTAVSADETKAINQSQQEITVENHFDYCPEKVGVQASTKDCGGEETPTYACSDKADNDEDGLIDAADPACHSDHDVNNPASYTPTANSEVYEAAQCSDGKENDSDGLIDSNDPGCHTDGNATDNDDTYNPDDNEESNGSNRSGSIPNGGGSVLGAFIGPAVLGDNMCGEYITDYIKLGAKNDPANVSRLQTFLNEYLGLSLKVDGNYGPATFEAVKQFQIKEAGEVLNPWIGVTLKDKVATGWVYKTTRRWINMIKCPELNIPKFEKTELTVR